MAKLNRVTADVPQGTVPSARKTNSGALSSFWRSRHASEYKDHVRDMCFPCSQSRLKRLGIQQQSVAGRTRLLGVDSRLMGAYLAAHDVNHISG